MGGYTDKPIQSMMPILLLRVVTNLAVHPDSGGSVEDGMAGMEGTGKRICNAHVDMSCGNTNS
jgi:hypothetical protein